MSIYGWAWGHGRLVPAKPAERMSMDEALRGICFGAVLDISRCQQCGGKCPFGERVLELMDAGEQPIPNNAPDPTRKEKALAERLKLNNRIMTRNNQRAKGQTEDKVRRAEALIAGGMSKIDAAKAVGYSGYQGLLAAQKAVRRRRVAEVDRLRAQGMTALQASIAAGYANEKCYYKAKKGIEAQERWKNV